MFFEDLRERINLKIYSSKDGWLRFGKILNAILIFCAIIVLVGTWGFEETATTKKWRFIAIQASFSAYILNYILRIIFNFNFKKFIKDTWFELVLVIYLILDAVVFHLTGHLLFERLFRLIGIKEFARFSMFALQIGLLLIVLSSMFRESEMRIKFQIHPALAFAMSLATIVIGGSLLLMMPEMTVGGIEYLDALFVSTSAASVTGLSTVDIPSVFTMKGQFLILALIKLGGLNIISFGAFMLLANKFGVSVKYHEVIEDFYNKDSLLSTRSVFGRLVIWSLIIEFFGAILIFFTLGDFGSKLTFNDRAFVSIFHSVSAFNNAGISVFPDGLYGAGVRNNMWLQGAMVALIFLGSLGMGVIFDVFSIRRIKERFKMKWKQIEIGSKISVYYSLVLIFIGSMAIILFEYNNTFHGKKWYEIFVGSVFQSINRTAGFNNVDIGALSIPTIFVIMCLMFVGGSSGSTGGGMKTSTLAIVWASLRSVVKGGKVVELYKRTVPGDIVTKAFVIFMFFVLTNLAGVFILSITEMEFIVTGKMDVLDILFEQVSAFSTVGLSRGVTSELSEWGKMWLIFTMYLGRVGALTLAYVFGSKIVSRNYKYPETRLMVG